MACSGDAGVDGSRLGVVRRDRCVTVASRVIPDVDIWWDAILERLPVPLLALGADKAWTAALGRLEAAPAPLVRRVAEFSRSSHCRSSLLSSEARRSSLLKLAMDGSSSRKSSSRPEAAWIRLETLAQACQVLRCRSDGESSGPLLIAAIPICQTRLCGRREAPADGGTPDVQRGKSGVRVSVEVLRHSWQYQSPAGSTSRPTQIGW